MYENFYKIDKSKQKKILDAAMMEFSRYGYSKTSVEQIAKAAEISKSMVFHYFGNKESLYNFLIIYCCDYLLDKYRDYIELIKDLDYIERYHQASIDKLKYINEEAALMKFSVSIYLHPESGHLSKESIDILSEVNRLSENYAKILHAERKDTKLRKDIPIEESLKYIKWIMDGYAQELTVKLENKSLADMTFEEDWDEFNCILDNLRKIFYLGEGEGDDNE